MRGKRVLVSDDEDEDDSSQVASTSKRARTVEFDSDPEVRYYEKEPKKVKSKDKGKAKARQEVDLDSEEEVVADIEYNEEEEQKFEEEHEDLIRAAIHAKRNVHGGVAEYGIIESIELHQFMCHKRLTFKFGEQINFVIGRNGSGKSAVLSAITVALGGKSASTGRGTGIKSFIREGQSVAEVTIQLKNQGEEAFKPNEYGKSIFVTRRFTKEGSSSWKIKSYDGKVISTKKEELAAICDHMNIQVDNPMNILTQDAARQFLSTAHATDKYKFFLRGTQLTQLSDEYDACLENISQTTKILHKKKEAVPDLRAAFKEASARFQEASKAREQKQKADDLKKELAWAHVASKKTELDSKAAEIKKAQERVPKIEDELKDATAAIGSTTELVANLEAEHRELGNIENIMAEKKELNEKMRANKNRMADFTADMKTADESIKRTRKVIEDYEKRIQEETAKMENLTQGRREQAMQLLDDAKREVQDAEQHLKDVCERKRQKLAEEESMKKELEKLKTAIDANRKRITEIQEILNRCTQKEKDGHVAYGNNIQPLLNEIQRMKWRGEVIGPLGLHVKLKDPEKWGPLLRVQLGLLMTSFAVTNPQDREQLKNLLKKYNNPGTQIIIGAKDLFDYSEGEPAPEVPTVLRALEVNHPWVLRILINANNVERTVLAPSRARGQEILSRLHGGGIAWTADMYRVIVFPEGGGSNMLLRQLPPTHPSQMLFSNRGAAEEAAHWKRELVKVEHEHMAADQEYTRLAQAHGAIRRELDSLGTDERNAHDRIGKARALRDSLQEDLNSDMPVAVSGLEAAKEEAIKEKESILAQFEVLVRGKGEVGDAQRPLLTQLNRLKVQIEEYEGKRAGIAKKIEDAVEMRMKGQNQEQHFKAKLAQEQEKIAGMQRVADDLKAEFEDWTTQAEKFCERWEKPRPVAEVKRRLDSVQRSLEERERRHGATVEEMTIEVNKAKANLDSVQADLMHMSKLNKALKSSLIIRLARWQEFRRHIALRCKVVFQYHLSQRGYYGKVLFDHGAGTLHLKVRTDDQAGTQSREKDPRSLSGGEKSIATICLLLSLWDSIGCPLRCLDEFDVYMDAVNRRVSIDMIVKTANASNKKQYILITPLDMTNVHVGPTIRVNRMPDPERGQDVLT